MIVDNKWWCLEAGQNYVVDIRSGVVNEVIDSCLRKG